MTVGDWATIASAAGTLAAVVVALFGPKFRATLLRPRLKLTVEEAKGCPVGGVQWYHLRVKNPKRWSPVTAVRVFLLKIEAPGRPDLSWTGQLPFRWRFAERPDEARNLGYDTDCDLCAISGDDENKILRLQPATPWGGPRVSYERPCHLKLTFRAHGVEADSRKLIVTLNWTKNRALTLVWADGGK